MKRMAPYAQFFWQDVVTEVASRAGEVLGAPEAEVVAVGMTPEWEATLGWALGASDDRLEAGVWDWIERGIGQLALTGEACFEVVAGDELPSKDKVSLVVEEIGPKGRLVTALGVVQCGWVSEDEKGMSRIVNWVPARRVHRIALPAGLGGIVTHRLMMWALEGATLGVPGWAMGELESGPTHLSIAELDRMQVATLARVTRRWGWPVRFALADKVSADYHRKRMIRWRWAIALVREHLVSELNALIRSLGCEGHVQLEHAASSQAIARTLERLEADGETPAKMS